MNQTQLKYARERAAAIKRRKEEKLSELYRDPPGKLTADQKLAALKAGKFTIAKKGSGRWEDRVIFDDEPKGLSSDEYNVRYRAIRAAYDTLIDELVLGDNEKALELLKAFEEA